MPARCRLPFIAVALLLISSLTAFSAPLLVGFSSPERDARRAEFLNYNPLRQDLFRQGLSADLLADPLVPAELKQFDTLILETKEEMGNIDLKDPAQAKALLAERTALRDYVAAGGGLVILATGVRYPGDRTEQYYNELFADFGLKYLHEGNFDPATKFTAPGTPTYGPQEYFWVTNFAPHPVTAGVTRLALPHYAYGKLPGSESLGFDPNWTTVASGSPTAASFKVDPTSNEMLDGQVGTYPSAPPIVAVRSFGQGRIVAWSLHPLFATYNFGNPLWPGTAETTGDVVGKMPSQGHTLLLNALRWTAAPAAALPGFGGRVIPEKVERVQFPATIPCYPNPFAPPAGAPLPPPLAMNRGIIGAHTSYSDGTGTVAQYADAAKAAGLAFLVFCDNLEALSPEKLAALKADCLAASAATGVYCQPGVEYSDVNGCRWAIYGDEVVFPDAKLWTGDHTRILAVGGYVAVCHYVAKMLLTYNQLPGDPQNLWWYYRLPLWVYDNGQLVADNLDQYLLASEDLDELPVACFDRIRSPQAVAAAAGRCTLNLLADRPPHAFLNMHCAEWGESSFVSQGGAAGPQVSMFFVAGTDGNLYQTAGVQRFHGYFRVYSTTAGIQEVRVHDGVRGLYRRYLAGGVKDFSQEFEVPLNRQHYLVLEVIDTAGRRAVWTEIRLFSYKQGIFRCGDNLNLLGSTPTCASPDRHDVPVFATFEDNGTKSLQGFDTGSGVLTQPNCWWNYNITTTAGEMVTYNYKPTRDDTGRRLPQMAARFPFASHEISVWTAASRNYVKWLWDSPAEGPFMPVGDPLPYADLSLRVYFLRSRINYQTLWDYRRAHEGSEDYLGDIFLHEGTLTFKQDVTLKGDTPLHLCDFAITGGSAWGLGDHVSLCDRDKGLVQYQLKPGDMPNVSGPIRQFGYVTGYPTDAGAVAIVPLTDNLRYHFFVWDNKPEKLYWRVETALGKDGQQLKAGDVVKFAYLAVSIPAKTKDVEAALTALPAAFGMTPGGYQAQLEAGKLVDQTFFFTAAAENHEFIAKFTPCPMLLNRPFRIQGLEDNGAAAVYVLEGPARQKHFRFVGVYEGSALFQQDTDTGVKLWAGNIFYADNAALKLSPVLDGLAPGEQPFLEVHNPTDAAITATLQAPPHTPLFAGFSQKTTVPAGASVRLPLTPKP